MMNILSTVSKNVIKTNTFKKNFVPSLFNRTLTTQIDGRLNDEVALVTGAAGGIGRATCLLFAKNGAKGIVCCDVDEKEGNETARMINDLYGEGKAVFQKCDVSNECDNLDAVAEAESTYGKLSIAFFNAGVMLNDDGDAISTEEKAWDLTMDINVKGVWFGCKHAIPALRRNGGGSIINTASFVSILGAATPQLAYTASKVCLFYTT